MCADFGLEGSSKIVPYTSNVVKAIEMCDHDVSNLVIFQRPEVSHQSQDVASSKKMNVHDFQKLLDDRSITCEDAVALNANDPLYTIYTSGTTGDPKGILRDHTHIVPLSYVVFEREAREI